MIKPDKGMTWVAMPSPIAEAPFPKLGQCAAQRNRAAGAQMERAFVFGSIAKQQDTAASDVDLQVVPWAMQPVRGAGKRQPEAGTKHQSGAVQPAVNHRQVNDHSAKCPAALTTTSTSL